MCLKQSLFTFATKLTSTYFGQAFARKYSACFFQSSLSSITVFSSLMLSRPVSLSNISINETDCLPTLLRSIAGCQSTSLDAISSGCHIQCPASFILPQATFEEIVGKIPYSCLFVTFSFHEMFMAILNILV